MRGCVTQKGKRWYVVFYNKESKKHEWSQGFETQADAEKYANNTATRLIDGGRLPDRKLTVKTYLDEWLKIRKGHIDDTNSIRPKGKIRSTTWAKYEELIRLYILPTFGPVPLTKLTRAMVEEFYDDKRTEGAISSATLQQIHLVLHKSFQDAMMDETITRNVFDLVVAPGIINTIPKKAPWDFEQVRLFLAEAHRSSKRYVLYLFTLCTASRVSEVLGLQRCDLDLLLGEVHFCRKMYRLYHKDLGGKKIIEGPPKSQRTIRDIPLIPLVVDELRKHLATQETLRAEFGNTYSSDGNGRLVFCRPNGQYLHKDVIARDFQKVIERAKLPHIRFHDLKHCTASYLRALGVDDQTVSTICGHHSAAFTDRHYVHTVNSTMREAMKKLEGALSLSPRGEGNEAGGDLGTRRPHLGRM